MFQVGEDSQQHPDSTKRSRTESINKEKIASLEANLSDRDAHIAALKAELANAEGALLTVLGEKEVVEAHLEKARGDLEDAELAVPAGVEWSVIA